MKTLHKLLMTAVITGALACGVGYLGNHHKVTNAIGYAGLATFGLSAAGLGVDYLIDRRKRKNA